MKKQLDCNKAKFTYKKVVGFLYHLKKDGYKKQPWRNEISYYKCKECKSYHVSSIIDEGSKSLIKDKTYFEHQKDKWNDFLQNYSSKKAVIHNNGKGKYRL